MDYRKGEPACLFDFKLLDEGNESAKPWYWTDSQEEQDKKDWILNEGFLKPDEITILDYERHIRSGQVLECFLICGYAVDNLYLVDSKEYPANVNEFIDDMTAFYQERINESTEKKDYQSAMQVPEDQIKPGGIVAVYAEKEWKRARILRNISHKESDPVWEVLLVELGEKHNVRPKRILYLHRDFVDKPAVSFKTRLGKMDARYSDYLGFDRNEWNAMVMKKLLWLCFEHVFTTKFLRKVKEEEDNWIWEVEIVDLVRVMKHQNRYQDCDDNDYLGVEGTVEDKAVALAMRELERKKKKKERASVTYDTDDTD